MIAKKFGRIFLPKIVKSGYENRPKSFKHGSHPLIMGGTSVSSEDSSYPSPGTVTRALDTDAIKKIQEGEEYFVLMSFCGQKTKGK